VAIGIDAEAQRRLEVFWRERDIEPNPDRLRMARIPAGASLIDNDVSAAPGFKLGNVHVMAGVPRIMRAMLEHILPTLPSGAVTHATSVVVTGMGEGDLAAPLRAVQERFPGVDLGSYPGQIDGVSRVELVARSQDEAELANVRGALLALVEGVGGTTLDS